ncbi:PqqD family protein [Actinoplanes sp. NPDC049599]|uniref:PqqD family protein n=1 Tax=Actinoplanes sp. NPDC049599 TaxID=3363903 RepID=UPI0037BD36E9
MSLHISESVIWNETAGGVSLYHTDTGEFLTLNETGAQIWVLLAADGDRESVINRLCLLFGGPSTTIRNRIRADVDAFIDDMIRDGLLAESVAA